MNNRKGKREKGRADRNDWLLPDSISHREDGDAASNGENEPANIEYWIQELETWMIRSDCVLSPQLGRIVCARQPSDDELFCTVQVRR